jgi:uncharacterized phage protein (TIGR02218 family)
MRIVPAGLVDAETLSLAHGWHITLTDGTVLGFTDHDEDIVIDGVTYLAASGYTASAIETSGALSVDNLEVEGMLEAPSITENDLRAGRWDFAEVEIFLFNWRDPDAGQAIQRYGHLGEVSAAGGRFRAEVRGLMQQLQQSMGQIYQPACRADFGDAQCGFNAATVTFSVAIESISSDGRTISSAALTQAAGYFDQGKAVFSDGPNVGHIAEVKSGVVGAITLQMPPPYEPEIGNTIAVTAGCQKRWNEDCKTKFDNLINFRGEPHLPGMNQVMQGAQRG